MCCVFVFKQKTAYEMRISDWSSDVCSSDLFLVFEWEGIEDPAVFRDAAGFQDLLKKTFHDHRHVAAIALRCNPTRTRMAGSINYATDAYLATSEVTTFPEVSDILSIDATDCRIGRIYQVELFVEFLRFGHLICPSTRVRN